MCTSNASTTGNRNQPKACELPRNIEAEREILAHCLWGGEIVADLKAMGLRAADFSHADHRMLFDVILRMHTQGKPVSSITVAEEIGLANPSDERRAYLEYLQSPSSCFMTNRKHTLFLAAIVRTKAQLRRIMHIGEGAIKAAQTPGAIPEQIAADLAGELNSITGAGK